MDEIRLGSRTLQPHRQLLVNGRREPIGKRALDILSVLAEAKAEIVTKEELLEAVWPNVIVEENALQVHIVALRKALGPEAERLKTIRGVGYQLDVDSETAPVSEAAGEPASTPRPALQPVPVAQYARYSWLRARSHRIALAVVVALALLAGAWAMFGSELGLRPKERIPVVVRELTTTTAGDVTEAALAKGVTDELIIRLRRIPDLRVATAEPDGTAPSGTFAKAYLVDGSIRRTGNQLRVTARLSSASGEVLWSQTFDRPLADLLNVQEAIAAAIADALSVSLDIGTNATAYGGTDNPEAFAAYLQFQATQLDPDQDVPTRYLERALALDPHYIKALNALSVSYGLRANASATRAQALAWLAKMDDSTARAITANPDLWGSHAARAYYYGNSKDFRSGMKEVQRVAELDDGTDPDLRSFLIADALNLGRTREALALLDSNELIDPIRRNSGSRVWALANAGHYREALDLFDRLQAQGSVSASLARWAYWSYLALGEEADARGIAERYIPSAAGELAAFDAIENSLLAMSGEEMRRWALRRYGDGSNTELAGLALLASYRGHPKLAVDLLRLANERPGAFAISTVLWTPLLANTRKTSEFAQFMTDIGAANLWRETGHWPDACRPLSSTEITCH